MRDDRITRRSLLAGLAGASAAGLLPARAVAARTPAPAVFDQWLGDMPVGVVTVSAQRSFNLVGVEWSDPPRAGIELRTPGAAGAGSPQAWGPWARAGAHGHGPDGAPPARARPVIGDPVWVGGADRLQLRATSPLRGVRLRFVDVGAAVARGRAASAASALTLATPRLDAGPGQPPIVSRDSWAQGGALPRRAPGDGAVRMAFVHHTENPNGYAAADVPAMLTAIFLFHRDTNGWNDIGYNFVVDLYGRIFEARAGGIDEPVVGAHAGGYNTVSTGVAVLGTFIGQPVSAAGQAALANLLAWKLSLHGVPVQGRVTVRVDPAGASYSIFPAGAHVSLRRVSGHRDGDLTDCPGDRLYGELPALRRRAAALAGTPLRLTLSAAAPGSGPPLSAAQTPGVPAPPILSGTLRALDGSPVAGATLALQERHTARRGERVTEQTIGQALTGADGSWSLALGAQPHGPLRALHVGAGGAPSAVSDPLGLGVAPAITLAAASTQLASGAPLALRGSVSPPRPLVRIVVWQVRADGSLTVVDSVSLHTAGGRFAASIALSPPGNYRCLAETPADATDLAGASAPVDVTVAQAPAASPAAAAPRRS